MYRPIMDAIINELNVGLCMRDITNHWSCRCTVPGPGMRAAGEILKRRYDENGAAHAQLIPYPADDRTEWLDGAKNPLEWRPHSAELRVVGPESASGLVCRSADEPLCLVSNSTSPFPDGVCVEVVVRNGALKESEFSEGELAGAILFTDQPPGSVEAAARKGGAVGIVSDCVCPPWLASHPPVREPEDAPDLVMWTRLSARRDQSPLFGFNLSPRQGRRLRQTIAQATEPVVLQALVDAELVEGSSDFVHAVLPGTDLAEEEIWVLAHLSEPGARDNASGCCLSLELARTLTALIAAGRLPPLRRTIRFMHAVEVSGFLPYIQEYRDRLTSVVAGICIDSVGQDFSICGGELVLFQSPEEAPSFVDGLMESLLTAAKREPAHRFSRDNYAIFPWHTEPFWGNDAFVSDGFFDIPAPQLSTWPDRFYHSNMDTPDQMSDNTLGRVGVAVGTYLHLLATAGEKEALWFGHLAAQDWRRRIVRAAEEQITAALTSDDANAAPRAAMLLLHHLGLQGYDAVLQAQRFAPDDDQLRARLIAIAEDLIEFAECESLHVVRSLVSDLSSFESFPLTEETPTPDAKLIARRLRWGAPPEDSLSEATRARLAEISAVGERQLDLTRIWKWIDGRRTAWDICERLRYGGEIPLNTIIEYLRLMEGDGMVEIALSTSGPSTTTALSCNTPSSKNSGQATNSFVQ